MKTVSHLLINLLLGAIGLTLAFALMLRFHTAPPTAFTYLLSFTALRSITIFTVTRERLIEFFVASLLCMAASFWVLRSSAPSIWERQDDFDAFSIFWRSAVMLLCILAIPRYASHFASRSIKPLRRPVT